MTHTHEYKAGYYSKGGVETCNCGKFRFTEKAGPFIEGIPAVPLKQIRDQLIEAYHDYFNNYLTTEKFAEHNGLTKAQTETFLALAKEIENSKYPEE